MCGIIGYTGSENVKDVLLDALELLEYRGYDSAGIAVKDETSGNTFFTDKNISGVFAGE